MPSEEQKPTIMQPTKSSMEILSELFSTFDAEPPLIIKKESTENASKKHKKSKKKHKHKEKKHKKKDKKRKRNDSSSSESSEIDLAKLLIKKERESPEKKLKTDGAIDLNSELVKIKKESEENLQNNGKKVENIILDATNKITIQNLKFSSILENLTTNKEQNEKGEEGELVISENSNDKQSVNGVKVKKNKHKRKHKHSKHVEKSSKKKHQSNIKEKVIKLGNDNHKTKDKSNHKSKDKSDYKEKYKSSHYKDKVDASRDRSREKDDHKNRDSRDSNHSDYKDKDDYKYHRHHDNFQHKDEDSSRSKDDHHERDKEEKWFMRDRYRGYSERDREWEQRYRERSSSRDRFDKKKLLEIARKNAIQMMKSGNLPGALTLGPQAQEKVIAAIRSGGKTIEELTDFCKTLSKKEEMGDLSSVSDNGESDSDMEKPFHHPFQIKDRPTSIVMNIKNSVPLPTKTAHERTAELRIQFPVSSGQQHRKTENEWVIVAPKKTEPLPKPPPPVIPQVETKIVPLPVKAPPIEVPPVPVSTLPGPQVFPATEKLQQNIDIASIVTQRLTAMRKLQENPNDSQAITEIYKSQKEMQTWAESKQQPGQFTGTTGAQILSQAELSSGFQAWARKDQFQNAAPVSGGMGMHLLQKMGWRPGEGLGKEKNGALEPLLLDVKLDKKGLVANEEQKRKQAKAQKMTVKTLEGKHPVSLLGEFSSKRKLGAPQYTLCFECGPDHKKNFLFKVLLNGVEYKPNVASPNKKQAKAEAARVCLQQLGLLI